MAIKEKLKKILKDDAIEERLNALENRVLELEASVTTYEEFEGEDDEVRITMEVYNAMCEYLDEDEIELMGLT
tara:strand:+ start:944 stop:1162 length:219 start_codon:yes stop_codon:yes gene_type:complete